MQSKLTTRRSLLAAASATTAIVAMPTPGSLAEMAVSSEFVELCRECVFAHRTSDAYRAQWTDTQRRFSESVYGSVYGGLPENVSKRLAGHLTGGDESTKTAALSEMLFALDRREKAPDLVAAEERLSRQNECARALWERLIETRATSQAEIVLKTAVAERCPGKKGMAASIYADFEALGMLPDWGASA